METFVLQVTRYVALGMEAGSALLIAVRGLQALFRIFTAPLGPTRSARGKRDVWVHFGMWLLLGLEFELGADVIKTTIAPTWSDIGQLGAIAAIRVFLNYFLTKDIERYDMTSGTTAAEAGR